MGIEFEKQSFNLKVDLMNNIVSQVLEGTYTIDYKPIKKISGSVFSYTIKKWEDGNITATLGITDEISNMWLTHNAKTYFAVSLYNKLLNLYGKRPIIIEFWTSKSDDGKSFLNSSVMLDNKKIQPKYAKEYLPSKESLIEEMLLKYSKAGQPKPEDETEPPPPEQQTPGYENNPAETNDDGMTF
jgi:hypothetical protein